MYNSLGIFWALFAKHLPLEISPSVMRQPARNSVASGYSSEDEKIFAFGLLPSKLAFILPWRAFCFLYLRANGDLNSTR